MNSRWYSTIPWFSVWRKKHKFIEIPGACRDLQYSAWDRFWGSKRNTTSRWESNRTYEQWQPRKKLMEPYRKNLTQNSSRLRIQRGKHMKANSSVKIERDLIRWWRGSKHKSSRKIASAEIGRGIRCRLGQCSIYINQQHNQHYHYRRWRHLSRPSPSSALSDFPKTMSTRILRTWKPARTALRANLSSLQLKLLWTNAVQVELVGAAGSC